MWSCVNEEILAVYANWRAVTVDGRVRTGIATLPPAIHVSRSRCVAGLAEMVWSSIALERREALANLSLEHPRINVRPHWLNVDGPTMLEATKKHHLEGVVANNISSIYQPGRRSRDWLKTPLRANCEAVLCGFVPGSGGAAGGVGSLILGAHDD